TDETLRPGRRWSVDVDQGFLIAQIGRDPRGQSRPAQRRKGEDEQAQRQTVEEPESEHGQLIAEDAHAACPPRRFPPGRFPPGRSPPTTGPPRPVRACAAAPRVVNPVGSCASSAPAASAKRLLAELSEEPSITRGSVGRRPMRFIA